MAIFILQKGTSIYVDGSASSSPNPCLSTSSSSEFAGKAVCGWIALMGSGTEHLTFTIQFASSHIQTYEFTAGAGMGSYSSGGATPIYSSMSSQSFAITAGNTYELTVTTTYPTTPVTVTVDGTIMASNPIELTPGTHSVSAPRIVQIDNVTRLKFDHWDDGSTQPVRSVNVQSDTTVEATFTKQYSLTLVSPSVNATGSGWYDDGSTASFSVPSSIPAQGSLGVIGGQSVFQGWYENGVLKTTSSTGTISMSSAHSLVAEWRTDYTAPIIVIVIILAAVGAIAALAIRKKSKRITEPTKPPNATV
jgi:hypothetical protein